MNQYPNNEDEVLMDLGAHEAEALIPTGTVLAFAVKQYELDRSKPNQLGLKLQFVVTEPGQYNNQIFFEYLCLQHVNPRTVAMAAAKMKKLFIAVGFDPDSKTSVRVFNALAGKAFIGEVGINKGTNGYADSNEIKKFSAMVYGAPGAHIEQTAPQQPQQPQQEYQPPVQEQPPAQQQAPMQQQQAPTANKMPWET